MATEREILQELEKKLNNEYEDTLTVIKGKIDDFTKDFDKDNKLYLKKLKDGEIDEKTYKKWYKKQVTTAKWCNDMIKELSDDMSKTNIKAYEIINGNTSEIFIQGCLEGSEEIENASNFDLIDREQAKILLEENGDLLPKATVDVPKDKLWNQRRMRSAVLQSAIKGESIPKLSKRLQNVVGMNRTSAIRNARTMMTGSHNLGKLETGYEALEMGINVKKKWIATEDGRTRMSHRLMNGEVVAMDEPFSNDLMYPADPDGEPKEVYNCRCTMGYVVGDQDELREDKFNMVDGYDMTDEWERRPDEFDFEIEDVINAQGFDGVPRVVDADEFDEYVKESNFIAQRTYSAPDQETLDAYRDQLYNGKWYVDCSTGGAQYGQGMYCAADYNGVLSDGIKSEMEHYKELGGQRFPEAKKQAREQYLNDAINNANSELERVALKEKIFGNTTEKEWDLYSTRTREQDRYFSKLADTIEDKASKIYGFNYTETITLDKSAKIINFSDLTNMKGNEPIVWRDKQIEKYVADKDEKVKAFFRINVGKATDNDFVLAQQLYNSPDEYKKAQNKYIDIMKGFSEKNIEMANMDNGTYAVLKGYDAINADNHGASGSYTVILNRTKVIIKRS